MHHRQSSGHYKRESSIVLWLTQSLSSSSSSSVSDTLWHLTVPADDMWKCVCISTSPTDYYLRLLKKFRCGEFVIRNSGIKTHVRKCADCERNSTSLITKKREENSTMISLALFEKLVKNKMHHESRSRSHHHNSKPEKQFVDMKSKQIVAFTAWNISHACLDQVHGRLFHWIPELMRTVRKVFVEIVRCVVE